MKTGKFSPPQFLELKRLATDTVGINNSIFDVELESLLSLYKSLVKEIKTLEDEIIRLINEVHPHFMSIPGIVPISAAVIYAEYGDISNFSSPAQMLAFAGIEPGVNESVTAAVFRATLPQFTPALSSRSSLSVYCHLVLQLPQPAMTS